MHEAKYTGCVYLATNLTNGKAYIGKTISGMASRKITHRHAASHGRRSPFLSALRKYGFDGFGWLELFNSDDEAALLAAEVALIAEYRLAGARLYNLTSGGEGTSMPCSPERRDKASRAMKGRLVSDETRLKLRAANLGRKHSPESIAKIRAAKLGTKMAAWSDERRAKWVATWAAKTAEGYRASPETRAKQSEAAKRRAAQPGERERRVITGRKGAAVRWGR